MLRLHLIRRFGRRALALVVLVYLAVCGGLYCAQDALIFPAHLVTQSYAGKRLSISTEQGETQVLFIDRQSPCDVVYFGGNAEAVEASQGDLARAFKRCNVLSMVYRGYGASAGSPSQTHLYADALALYRLRQTHTRDFIIVGRSLGSSVATYLASQVPVKQLILVTPFDSMAALVQGKFPWLPTGLLLKNPFPSAEFAQQVSAPVHIIIAQEDEIIPARHTLSLKHSFVRTKPQLTQLGKVGHNTVDEHPAYPDVLGRML